MREKSPTEVDVAVGRNIRIYRQHAGMSQSELGEQIGVTFQQVQKYEKGANRVGASRLVQIAQALDVHLPTLFEGVKDHAKPTGMSPLDMIKDAATLDLVRSFAEISDARLRRAIVNLVAQIADPSDS